MNHFILSVFIILKKLTLIRIIFLQLFEYHLLTRISFIKVSEFSEREVLPDSASNTRNLRH